jgi:regulator of RNase E activity RraB
MGLFDFFKSNKEFIPEGTYEKILSNQEAITPKVVEQLRNIGITDDKLLKVEFFFYTNTADKAKELALELEKLNYEAYYNLSGYDKKLFVITGWTTPMQMDNDVIVKWAEKMCEIGYTYDCEFDGWGTTEDQ